MENQTRYDLNAAIENWRNELAAQPNLASDDRRELETHLRDAIAGFQQRGLNDEESFQLAKQRVGQPRQLGKEFEKVSNCHWNRSLATTAWFMFVVSLFLPVGGGTFSMRGYECAIAILPWHLDYSWKGIGDCFGIIQFNLMNLANLLMIVSPVLLRRFIKNARFMKWLRRVTLAASASVGLYFFEIIFLSDGHGRDFKIGFYVWVLSFALLCLSMLPQFMPTQNRKTPKRA